MQGEIDWVEVESQTNYTLVLGPNERYYNYKFGLSVKSKIALSSLIAQRSRRSSDLITLGSGTKWSDCAHQVTRGQYIYIHKVYKIYRFCDMVVA